MLDRLLEEPWLEIDGVNPGNVKDLQVAFTFSMGVDRGQEAAPIVAGDTMYLLPAVMIASTFLILDRLVGTHFFNPAEGGSALLWQHLFWFFGHPEVYIIFIPATGMVASIWSPRSPKTMSTSPLFGARSPGGSPRASRCR